MNMQLDLAASPLEAAGKLKEDDNVCIPIISKYRKGNYVI